MKYPKTSWSDHQFKKFFWRTETVFSNTLHKPFRLFSVKIFNPNTDIRFRFSTETCFFPANSDTVEIDSWSASTKYSVSPYTTTPWGRLKFSMKTLAFLGRSVHCIIWNWNEQAIHENSNSIVILRIHVCLAAIELSIRDWIILLKKNHCVVKNRGLNVDSVIHAGLIQSIYLYFLWIGHHASGQWNDRFWKEGEKCVYETQMPIAATK